MNFHEHVKNNLPQWKEYYDSNLPQVAAIPEPWNTQLSSFQKMIVLRCFRSDKLVPAVQTFVTGMRVLIFSLCNIYSESVFHCRQSWPSIRGSTTI